MTMTDDLAATFFQNGQALCKSCGRFNDFGSSQALYHAHLLTPCVYCGFRFLLHQSRQMDKLKELLSTHPQWLEQVKHGDLKLLGKRLDEIVPPIDDDQSVD